MTPAGSARCALALLAGAFLLPAPLATPPTKPPAPAGSPRDAAPAASRALVTVRTLVMDGLGTRTVDTSIARVPFNSKGLLVRKIPYGGPPLSFRLSVQPGTPLPEGIPLTLFSETWSGEASPIPPEEQRSQRTDETIVSAEASYLMEIEHDSRSDRRIVLSLSARPLDEATDAEPLETITPGEEIPIQFLLDTKRQAGATFDPPDTHLFNSIVGRPVTYSSRVQAMGSSTTTSATGLTIELMAEAVQGDLVTVRVRMTGAEAVDDAGARIEPIDVTERRTVASGSSFSLVKSVLPEKKDLPAGLHQVTYHLTVTPTVGDSAASRK